MQILLATTFRKAAAGLAMVMACSCGCSKEEEGPKTEELSTAVNRLIAETKYEEALPLAEAWLTEIEAEHGKGSEQAILPAHHLGGIYFRLGRLQDAENTYRGLLRVMEEVHGRRDVRVSTALNNVASVLMASRRFDEALVLYERSLEIRESRLGKNHLSTAKVLDLLGKLHVELGRYSVARVFRERHLAVMQTAKPLDHVQLGVSRAKLADVQYRLGVFAEAEANATHALETFEELLGEDHPNAIIALDRLATIFRQVGRLDDAEDFYKRALGRADRSLGQDHTLTLRVRGNLAILLRRSERYEAAERLFEEVIARQRSLFGEDDSVLADSYNGLAGVYRRIGHLDQSESLHLRALKIQQEKLGANAPEVVQTKAAIGVLYLSMHRLEEAIELLEEVLALQRDLVGFDNRDVVLTLYNLALAYRDSGNRERALELARRRARAMRHLVTSYMHQRDEQERIEFVTNEAFYTLFASLGAVDDLADEVLYIKSRVLDSVVADRRSEQASAGENREGHEEPVAASEVRSVLGEGQVLVEYLIYGRYLGRAQWELTCGALVFKKDQQVRFVDCGPWKEIKSTIARYEKAVQGLTDEEVLRGTCRKLYQFLVAPLGEELESVERLILSPDGRLHLISFAILMDGEDRFLVESCNVQYVDTGREMVQVRSPISGGPLATSVMVGAPRYHLAKSTPAGRIHPQQADDGNGNARLRGVGDRLEKLEFFSLPSTKLEAESVAEILRDNGYTCTVIEGLKATEDHLRSMAAPRALHLATHGFFLAAQRGDASGAAPAVRGTGAGDENVPWQRDNPMHRSGVALAGGADTLDRWRAGEVPEDESDGLLLASEVEELDLEGTELVTLSACNSGRGDTVGDEGVLGLRRGFKMAGAQQLLMALWPVEDRVTAEFMAAFYERYGATGDAAGSLAAAQREFLSKLAVEGGLETAVSQVGGFVVNGWTRNGN